MDPLGIEIMIWDGRHVSLGDMAVGLGLYAWEIGLATLPFEAGLGILFT